MWLKKIADHNWFDLDDPLLTLYHGTSEFALPSIQREGVKPLNEESVIQQIVSDAGLNPRNIPDDVFKQVIRRKQPWVYWSSNIKLAKSYCSYVGCGGEFANDIYKWLKIWADEHKLPINPMKSGKTFVIKADIPREMVFVHQGNVIEYFQGVYQTFMKNREMFSTINVNDLLDDREFLTKEIPAQYITDIMPITEKEHVFYTDKW